MKKMFIVAFVGIMFAVIGYGDEFVVANGKASIKFEGTSTLHDFEGAVQAVPFKISVRKDNGKLYATATVKVDILKMTTDHNRRDKNMYKML